MKYAEVAVNAPSGMRRTFSYSIPEGMSLVVGQTAWVPFGARRLQGIVFDITDEPAVTETRDIYQTIGSGPTLLPHQVQLARWIAENYLASYFESASAMLPPGFEQRVLTYLQAVPQPSERDLAALNEDQRQVFELVQQEGGVEFGELKRTLGPRKADLVVGQLLRRRLLTKTQQTGKARVTAKTAKQVRPALEGARLQKAVLALDKGRTKRQADLLLFLAEQPGPILLTELKERLAFSPSTLESLAGKGLVAIEDVPVTRDPLAHRSFPTATPPVLTSDQETVWKEVKEALIQSGAPPAGQRPPVFLLHGVTGSGKTEIYLRALEQAVALGKKGIVLVPEIALTPQTINRFSSRFPGQVAVLHSRLSLGEQFDEWWRIRNGECSVVIGSRGAIFAPQPDLGVIVIDEEHEWTYKQQEQSPRYHAREVAIKLAELTGAVVILGSATPDLVSYHRAQQGEFKLLKLPSRVMADPTQPSRLPQVELVDLRVELRQGNRSIFSRSLHRAMEIALAAGEQTILFLNRRGSATFVQCRDCGYVMRCKRCEISLTYHSAEEGLVCHQCNRRTPVPQVCPSCLSRRIKFLGIGTQKVEEEVKTTFPSARLLRWDRDVTREKGAHERILSSFLAHEADILIGTQMVAKGLDMPLVTLVGVINADVNLFLPQYHAPERTFQLLTQVAGRAGRGVLGGRVIVQTYAPDHYAVTAAAKHDYDAFYNREMEFRRELRNPPFSRMARLVHSNTNAEACQKEAVRFCQTLKQERDARGLPDIELLGPTPTFMPRLRGRYRWQIVVRGPNPHELLSPVPLPRGWAVDIDPTDLL